MISQHRCTIAIVIKIVKKNYQSKCDGVSELLTLKRLPSISRSDKIIVGMSFNKYTKRYGEIVFSVVAVVIVIIMWICWKFPTRDYIHDKRTRWWAFVGNFLKMQIASLLFGLMFTWWRHLTLTRFAIMHLYTRESFQKQFESIKFEFFALRIEANVKTISWSNRIFLTFIIALINIHLRFSVFLCADKYSSIHEFVAFGHFRSIFSLLTHHSSNSWKYWRVQCGKLNLFICLFIASNITL